MRTPRDAGGHGVGRGGPGPRSTTQIDRAQRLSWCTDVRPGPALYPKHGSHGAPARPATMPSDFTSCLAHGPAAWSRSWADPHRPTGGPSPTACTGASGAAVCPCETRVSGIASDPAVNRCTLTGAHVMLIFVVEQGHAAAPLAPVAVTSRRTRSAR